MPEKVFIVEGKSDKQKLELIIDEPVEVVCTHGTLGVEKLEQIIIPLQYREVYILVDADQAGKKLRRILRRELPNARHLFTRSEYQQVANTPLSYLAKILSDCNIQIKILGDSSE